MNNLYHGDNLAIMRTMHSESVDLIYLDPPFNSNRNYEFVSDQTHAFSDKWEMDDEKEAWLKDIPICRGFFQDLRADNPQMLAYLIFMTVRLFEMKRLLKDTGSIYLHCDPSASHYLKVVMDGIFGVKNFRNEIIWGYTAPSSVKKHFPRKHDNILFYAKSSEIIFNYDAIRIPYKKLNTNGGSSIGEPVTEKLRLILLAKGKIPESWWFDFSPVGRLKSERNGYPTQKPLSLLHRIIKASSNESDVVLDPFCGSGTAIYSAYINDRKWIGIDKSKRSIDLIQQTLDDKLDPLFPKEYEQMCVSGN